MTEPEKPKGAPKAESEKPKQSGQVIKFDSRVLPAEQPDNLSAADAIKIVKMLAADTDNIVLIPYAKKRSVQRRIERRPIERCVQLGTLTEGPFLNSHGNWQMNLYRHASGEELTCVVAIDWPRKLLVINAF
jgi:hypothetical protein